MGCECSTESNKNTCFLFETDKHPLVSEKLNQNEKARALEAIKKNDMFLTAKLLEKVRATENLLGPGCNYTCIHAAAEANSFQGMHALLEWVKRNMSNEYNEIINIPDSNNRTPAMICAVNDCPETLFTLLTNGGVDTELRDNEGKTLEELCKEKSLRCLAVLEHFRNPEKLRNMEIEAKIGFHSPRKRFRANPIKDPPLKRKVTGLDIVSDIQKRANKALIIRNIEQVKRAKLDFEKDLDDDLKFVPQGSKTFQLLTEMIISKKNFKDMEFPRNINSISTNVFHPNYDLYTTAVWKRPHEIFNCDYDKIYLFDSIDPDDIKQGTLGVCYFLSAVSAMAEYPSRILKMFINKKGNKYGVYGVKFYVMGIPTEIVVDDYIPCAPDENENNQMLPLFCRPKGNELWVLILEKAWAKLYGSYAVTEDGYMDEAFEYLMGDPSFRYYIRDQTEDETWETLKEADFNNWVVCAATGRNAKEEHGLIPSHAYTIVSVHEVSGYKIIRLRNPWGKFEWKGDFSDDSPLWTDELKSKVAFVSADDGIFFMTLKDFREYYAWYSVSAYHEGWEYSYITGENLSHGNYYKFVVTEPSELYLRVHLKDVRFYGELGRDILPYPFAELIVARVEKNGTFTNLVSNPSDLERVNADGSRTIYPSKHHKLKLDAGEYVAFVKVHWDTLPPMPYTISTYSNVKILFQESVPIKDFRKLLYVNDAKVNANKETHGKNSVLCHGYSGHNIYIFAENNDEKIWTLNIKFTTLENLRLGKYHRTTEKELRMVVPPGKYEIAYIKKNDYSEECKFVWEITELWQ